MMVFMIVIYCLTIISSIAQGDALGCKGMQKGTGGVERRRRAQWDAGGVGGCRGMHEDAGRCRRAQGGYMATQEGAVGCRGWRRAHVDAGGHKVV